MADAKNVEVVEEKVVNTTESIEDAKVDAKHTEVAKQTAKAIKNKKMVEIKIPIDPQNPKDLVVPVIINGYRWEIKRGEKVSVPEPVAKILEDSKYI
jgi:hypothetical protein